MSDATRLRELEVENRKLKCLLSSTGPGDGALDRKSGDSTLEDIEIFRADLRALLGIITLEPRDGILWAHPAPNAKGFTEVKPLDGLSINSPKLVAGARFALFRQR